MAKKNPPSQVEPAVNVLPPGPLWKRLYIDLASDVDRIFSELAKKKNVTKRHLLGQIVTDYVNKNGGK